MLGIANKGIKGSKTIPFASITAIQYKKPGITSGYLQFTLAGGVESRGGIMDATKDENTFLFLAKHKKQVHQIKEYIESQMAKLQKTANAPQPTSSMADELLKLAELKNKGILTEEEFLNAKAQLLN